MGNNKKETKMIDIENKIRKFLDKEARTNLNIEHIDIVRTIKLDKNDYRTLEDYPIVDKAVSLIEIEYYINEEGFHRCFAIEENTDRFLDVSSDILNLILKTNKRMTKLEDEIRRLDFEKADDTNIKCTKVQIEYKDGEEIVTNIGRTLPLNKWKDTKNK